MKPYHLLNSREKFFRELKVGLITVALFALGAYFKPSFFEIDRLNMIIIFSIVCVASYLSIQPTWNKKWIYSIAPFVTLIGILLSTKSEHVFTSFQVVAILTFSLLVQLIVSFIVMKQELKTN